MMYKKSPRLEKGYIPVQINDRFGAAAAFETVSLPNGTEAAVPTEHAAALYVNEQPAFRVVCTPELLPQLALGRLLTEDPACREELRRQAAEIDEINRFLRLEEGRAPICRKSP
mgnify:CR=1 FL=1